MIENIAVSILCTIFGGSVVYAGIYAYGKINYWKGMYETSSDDLDAALDKIAHTERVAHAVADKYSALNDFVNKQLERPIVLGLSDSHVNQIAATLSNLVMAQQNPNRLN